ncbi:MAG: hypothetical protein IPF96_21810 [Rhodobacter sp.]|nr:hypothetical protein [Rhodobacter sp.]
MLTAPVNIRQGKRGRPLLRTERTFGSCPSSAAIMSLNCNEVSFGMPLASGMAAVTLIGAVPGAAIMPPAKSADDQKKAR